MASEPPPKFPRGKLRADDNGEMAIRLVIQDATLLLIFPGPVTWIGLGIDDLERWIGQLTGKLAELKAGSS